MYNNNNIIFTIARMNPPTPGHLYLIEKLIEKAIYMNTDKVYVILSKTNDTDEDPISCDKKRSILDENVNIRNNLTFALKNKMINDIEISDIENKDKLKGQIYSTEVIYKCVEEIKGETPINTLSKIIKEYKNEGITNINLFIIIGDDRKSMINTIEKIYSKDPAVLSINGESLDRESMEEYKNMTPSDIDELDMDNIPNNAFSASFIRKIVSNNLKNKFDDIYKKYIDNQDVIDDLYFSIKQGIDNLGPKNKSNKRKFSGKGGYRKNSKKLISNRKRKNRKTRKYKK